MVAASLHLQVPDVNFKHWAYKSIADGPDVAPSAVEGLLDVGPQFEDQVEPHEHVLALSNLELEIDKDCW